MFISIVKRPNISHLYRSLAIPSVSTVFSLMINRCPVSAVESGMNTSVSDGMSVIVSIQKWKECKKSLHVAMDRPHWPAETISRYSSVGVVTVGVPSPAKSGQGSGRE